MARLLLLGLTTALFACGDDTTTATDSGTETDADTDADTDSDTDSDTDTDTDTDTEEEHCLTEGPEEDPTPGTGTVVGNVYDGDGAPVAGVRVSWCDHWECLALPSGADGSVTIDSAGAGTHSFDAVPAGLDGYSTTLTILSIEPGETLTVDFHLPDLTPAQAVPATPTELELGDGLFVTLGEGTFALLFGDVTDVAGAKLSAEQWPTMDLEGTVVAVWNLDPFEAESTDGAPVRIANSWGYAPGKALWLHTSSYGCFEYLEPIELVVNGDGTYLESTGGTLKELSTVVLVDLES